MSDRMTAAERRELASLARKRARLAKDAVDAVAAQKLHEFEQQIASKYAFGDAAWANVTRAAEEGVRNADAEVARICRENGIPEEFRPRLSLSWYSRGESAIPERRAEIRKVAKAKIDAGRKDARAAIEHASVEIQTQLLAAGLTTEAAQAFLTSMPTPEALMPSLDVDDVEQMRQIESSGPRNHLRSLD